MTRLKTEVADATASLSGLVEAAICFEADASKARTGLQDLQAHIGKAEDKAKLAREELGKLWEQFTCLGKAAEKAIRQLPEMSS